MSRQDADIKNGVCKALTFILNKWLQIVATEESIVQSVGTSRELMGSLVNRSCWCASLFQGHDRRPRAAFVDGSRCMKRRLAMLGLGAGLVLVGAGAWADTPASLAPPAGARLVLRSVADGVQIYAC